MGKSNALGRGLGALLGEIEEAYENELPKQHVVLDIPLTEIRPNPYQPRKTFDEKSLAELADSLKQHGLLQPIVVVEDVDGYVLVAGERRLRASKLAKLESIRAVLASADSDQMRQHALVENIQRDELNVIDLAHAYEELIEAHGSTHDELSRIVHKSRAHISNTLRLLQLSRDAQSALSEGKITAGHAKVLVGLDDKEQKLMLDSIIGQKLSVREVESMTKQMKEPKNRGQRPEIKVGPDASMLRSKLSDLGFRAAYKGSKITVTFSDDDELDAFMSYFQ